MFYRTVKTTFLATVSFRSVTSSCRYLSSQLSTKKIDDSFSRTTRTKVCGKFAQNNLLFRPWFLRYIPKGGLDIQIDYIDTKPDADQNIKTIVILHNTPGSYYDYFKLIVALGGEYRVIIPNFPNFNYTLRTGCFWHSAEEKSEFVCDFLKHLNVNKVDCLIAHSLAAYTASYLWIYANWDTYFKLGSICIVSPVGQSEFSLKERARLSVLANMSRSPLLRQFMPPTVINRDANTSNMQNISSNFEIAGWKAITQKLSNYQNYHKRLRVLLHSKLPTLFIFSSNDKLYNPRIFYDQLYQLDVGIDDFDIYEQYENSLIQSSNDQSWIKVVDFRSAGHQMFNTHTDIVHSYIAELIDRSFIETNKLIEHNK